MLSRLGAYTCAGSETMERAILSSVEADLRIGCYGAPYRSSPHLMQRGSPSPAESMLQSALLRRPPLPGGARAESPAMAMFSSLSPELHSAGKRRSPVRTATLSPADSSFSDSSFASFASFSSSGVPRRSHSKEDHWSALIPPGKGGGMALRKACKEGEFAAVQMLIGRGASVHSYDEAFERTPLHFAAQAGHKTICALLISHGASVDAVDISCVAPLHLAAERGYADVCEWLCRSGGANVCAKTPSGSTPLHYAANNNHTETASALLAVMKDDGFVRNTGVFAYDDFRNNWGATPPELAREKGHTQLAEKLEAEVAVALFKEASKSK